MKNPNNAKSVLLGVKDLFLPLLALIFVISLTFIAQVDKTDILKKIKDEDPQKQRSLYERYRKKHGGDYFIDKILVDHISAGSSSKRSSKEQKFLSTFSRFHQRFW